MPARRRAIRIPAFTKSTAIAGNYVSLHAEMYARPPSAQPRPAGSRWNYSLAVSEDSIRGVSARLKNGDGPLCPRPAVTGVPALHVSGQSSQSPFLRRPAFERPRFAVPLFAAV